MERTMTTADLTRTETTLLLEAAERPGGQVTLPERLKPASRQRMAGKLVRLRLVRAGESDGAELVLLPAGYRAVGLRPPRRPRSVEGGVVAERPGTKQSLVLGLLAREDGASLAELTEATGWLPHTARAALSRLRSAGTALTRTGRDGGGYAYCIEQPPQVAA